jgi:hypothetical protein
MKNGENIIGGAIYGYRKSNGQWEHDPLAAEVVRDIFNMALIGKTTAQIRDKLIADKQLAPREYGYLNKGKDIIPEFNWTSKQIFRILTNEQYTGTYIAGKRETSVVGSKRMIEKAKSEWIVIPDRHPPIVSKENFAQVQKILKSPKEELDNGRKRSSHAKKLHSKIKSGERKPCKALFGYYIHESKEFEIDDTSAEIVKMIYELALQGFIARDIAEKLQTEKYLPPGEYFKIKKGADIQPTYRWATLSVREILKERQYTGDYVAGKTFQDEDGKKYHTPPSEWVIIPDKHPAIISKVVFRQVQERLSQAKRKMQPHNYLLKGKIQCGICRRAMSYSNTTKLPMYRCSRHCNLKVFTTDVENAVIEIIRKHAEVVLNSSDLSGFHRTEKKYDGLNVAANKPEIEKQINQLSTQKQESYERFVSSEIDRETFQSLKTDYTKRIDGLAKQLAVIKQSERRQEADKQIANLAKAF